ncbi:hypothetical protein EPUL_000553 [Erysiphe pulchra]|uniref:Ca3427-like PBP 2 domain-containing protein n=1 Tax=Erysiphe pulchra TaxID=225359 RepID=A0A2S4PWW3_9PEZI|nr:hypothetical protein EPUL_000553 [Erysiphe pulchra]
MDAIESLRIGYVPEHFSAPLFFAEKYFKLAAKLISFPSGTGHMITSLRSGEIDVAIGLTEAGSPGKSDSVYNCSKYQKLTRLLITGWDISAGARSSLNSVEDLKGCKCGVSRIGSGSYVMAYALALQQNWLNHNSPADPFEFITLQTFEKLRDAVNSGNADFFMWEHFTSKKYHDNGEIKRIGQIYTPWSSWKIVASTSIEKSDSRLQDLFQKLDKGIGYFNANHDEAIKYISTSLDYSEADARSWLETVKFSASTKGVDLNVIRSTVDVLRKASVLGQNGMDVTEMIAFPRVKN